MTNGATDADRLRAALDPFYAAVEGVLIGQRQVTTGESSIPLPRPFFVLATQNPVEQEGTYPLPEAQVDRFMLKVLIDYPGRADELAILDRMGGVDSSTDLSPVLTRPAL